MYARMRHKLSDPFSMSFQDNAYPSQGQVSPQQTYPDEKVDLVSSPQPLSQSPSGTSDGSSGGFFGKLKEYMSVKRNRYFVYISGVLLFAIICAAAVWYFQESERDRDEQIFSDEETLEILSGVIENNPQGILSEYDERAGSTLGTSVYSGDPAEDESIVPLDPNSPTSSSPIPSPVVPEVGDVMPAEEAIVPPDLDVYNYRHTETDYQPGPAYGQCYGTQWAPVYSVEDYYEYFDLDRSYYKYESTNKETNRLIYYSLGKYGSDINEYYAFRGGDFAARILHDIDPGFSNEWRMDPVSYPGEGMPISDRVKWYFGSDAQITDIFEVDGVLYYEVTATSLWNCYGGDHSTIWIYTVRADSLAVERKRGFLDSLESLSNLISDMTVTRDIRKVYLDEVEDDFVFEKVSEVVDVDYASYEYDADAEYARFVSHLESNGYNLVIPPLDRFDILSLYGKDLPERVENERYYLERSFYPEDGEGQDSYEQVIANRINMPLVSTGFTEDEPYGWFAVGLYSKFNGVEDLLEKKTKYTDSWNLSWSVVSIDVGDNDIIADKISVRHEVWFSSPISYPVSMPVSYPVTMPTSYGTWYIYPFYWTLLGFRYMDYPYVIENYGLTDTYLEGISYDHVEAGDIDQGEFSEALEWYFTSAGSWW
jgi:hypothetical protein